VLAVYALQRLQAGLPLNPAGMTAVSPDSAFNTAVSFVTNTNWQGYAGESTMSYLTQMLALAVQNFLSAATGIAVVFALIRGFAARSTGVIGNFWVDVTRITTWLLVPLSLVFAVFLVGQGVIQNFDAYKDVTTIEVTSYQSPKNGPDGQPLKDEKGNPVMEDMKAATQTLAMGPVASQEAIKMLGTNGGGFFNANSAHPYENPDRAEQFPADAGDLPDPRRLVLCLRSRGWRSAPGLGRAGGNDGDVCHCRGRHHARRAGRQSIADADGR
jgi:K+-transporting ATPase ATPase A chain